jgi:hypothetical protein
VPPAAGAGDALEHLEWADASCRRALLTCTRQGAASVWLQGASTPRPEPCCLDSWFAQPLAPPAQALGAATARLIHPPAAQPFSTQHVASLGDWPPLHIESALPPAGAAPAAAWVRPGALAVALVDASAQLFLCWEELGPEQQPCRSSGPISLSAPQPAALQPGHGPSTWAACAAEGCSVRVAFCPGGPSGDMLCVNAVVGNPVFAACSQAQELAPRVDAAATFSLPGAQQVSGLRCAARRQPAC